MLGFVFLRVLLTGLLSVAPAGSPDMQAAPVTPVEAAGLADIDFGDDKGAWAEDGECDDARFAGDGMGAPSTDHIGHDASDCRAAFAAGTITVSGASGGPALVVDGIEFGDDASMWANDDECDDKRFIGEGMTATVLLDDDIGHDASDCHAAWQAGGLTLFTPRTGDLVIDGVNFGDDSGDWPNDNQCDDPRFTGEDAADQSYDENKGKDATDCAAAWQAGNLSLSDRQDDTADSRITTPWIEDDVDFGTDSGAWANDGECDDPRFIGEGMTATTLLDDDIRADASDCLAGWRAGTLTLRESAGGSSARPAHGGGSGGAGKISNNPGQR